MSQALGDGAIEKLDDAKYMIARMQATIDEQQKTIDRQRKMLGAARTARRQRREPADLRGARWSAG